MRTILSGILALLAVLSLSVAARAQGGESEIRFVHAALASGPVDIRVDGQPIIFDLPAGQSTAYGRVMAGTHTVSVHVPGRAVNEGVLLSQSVTLAPDTSYTLVALEQGGALAGTLFTDDRASGAGGGNGSLRVVNATSDGTSLGAVIDGAALTPLLKPGEASDRTLSSLANPTVSVVNDKGETLLTTPALPLGNGELYTLIVAGRAGEFRPIVVSYPLGAGLSAESKTWQPLTATQRIAPPTTTQAVPQRTLPATGGEIRDVIPLMLIANGVLLAILGTAVAGWLQQRAARP